MWNLTAPSRQASILTALLAAAALAGCTGASEDASGFDEAMAAPGQLYEPAADASLRLKLLEPADPGSVSTGDLPVRFLLFDSSSSTPVTDASFTHPNRSDCGPDHSFCAEHPEHGHGTSPETSPEHVGDGVYEGGTTMSMGGTWRLNVNPELADGTVLEFDIELQVDA